MINSHVQRERIGSPEKAARRVKCTDQSSSDLTIERSSVIALDLKDSAKRKIVPVYCIVTHVIIASERQLALRRQIVAVFGKVTND